MAGLPRPAHLSSGAGDSYGPCPFSSPGLRLRLFRLHLCCVEPSERFPWPRGPVMVALKLLITEPLVKGIKNGLQSVEKIFVNDPTVVILESDKYNCYKNVHLVIRKMQVHEHMWKVLSEFSCRTNKGARWMLSVSLFTPPPCVLTSQMRFTFFKSTGNA